MSRNRDRLVRLDDGERILSRQQVEAIAERVFRLAQGGGETRVRVESWWQGELRWGRNRVSLASDRRDVSLSVIRGQPFGAEGAASTNQFDDVSVEAAVRAAERALARQDEPPKAEFLPQLPKLELPQSSIWSDATYNL